MRGTAQVSIVDTERGRILEMPCDFKGTKISRASWDLRTSLDLTTRDGIQFDIFCENTVPISNLTIYFKSGAGWYSRNFFIERMNAWNRIKIRKTETGIEGSPAGWSDIKKIRLSVWRGRDVSTTIHIANLGFIGGDAKIAVIRAESAMIKGSDEAEAAKRYAGNVAAILDAAGIPFVMLSDLDLTADKLRETRIAVLPHNPGMPSRVISALKKYVGTGGKIIAFYTLPRELRDLVGIPGGEFIRRERAGQFSSIRFRPGTLKGAPAVVKQESWNIQTAKALEGRSRVAAWWFDNRGRGTGRAAVVVSDKCVLMTHVLLLDDMNNKQLMLLAMAATFDPAIWKDAARKKLKDIARTASYSSFEEAAELIRSRKGKQNALKLLREAATLRDRAEKLFFQGAFPKAFTTATDAKRTLIRAFCAAQKPQPREHRAWWCHSAFGVPGMTWDQAVKKLADNGFTAIMANMLWGGTAFYESGILPVSNLVKTKGDQIALCLKACRKYGIECHIWKVNWNMGSMTTRKFVERMRKEGRTQELYDGTPKERWLCPSNPKNQRLEIDSMLEIVRKYDIDGIHFDYIRYPGPDACFCDGCRRRFERLIGRKVDDWPSDCRNNPEIKRKWLEFRRSNITKVVAEVSAKARRIKPRIKISAAVFRSWPMDRDDIGQDWKLWCDKGYLDFVCPMDYTPSDARFENMVKSQKAWTGSVPCYPGIGLSCWKSGGICALIEQIKITRELRTGGFTIFNYGKPEANEILPLCGAGITKETRGGTKTEPPARKTTFPQRPNARRLTIGHHELHSLVIAHH